MNVGLTEGGGHHGKTQLHALCDLTLFPGEGCISSFRGDVILHVSCNSSSCQCVCVCACCFGVLITIKPCLFQSLPTPLFCNLTLAPSHNSPSLSPPLPLYGSHMLHLYWTQHKKVELFSLSFNLRKWSHVFTTFKLI